MVEDRSWRSDDRYIVMNVLSVGVCDSSIRLQLIVILILMPVRICLIDTLFDFIQIEGAKSTIQSVLKLEREYWTEHVLQ